MLAYTMINLNQLRAFYQAAKSRNLNIAAQALFVSQPAVTAQIKLFEESCGLKLFKKKGRNLHLTDEGKILYTYARKIFEYEKKIEDAVAQIKELKKGSDAQESRIWNEWRESLGLYYPDIDSK